jgi:hypothetical protein
MINLDKDQIMGLIEYHKRQIQEIEGKIRALEMYLPLEMKDGIRVDVRPVEEMFNPRRMVMDMMEREGRFMTTMDFVREGIDVYRQRGGVEFKRQMSNVLAGLKVAGKVVNYEVKERRDKYWGLPGWMVKDKVVKGREPVDK